MKFIKVIETNSGNEFEKYAENLISQGFTLSSSHCGFVNSEEYDFCSSYQGIFVRKEEDIKPIQGDYISNCCKDGCEYFNNSKGCAYEGEMYIKLISHEEYKNSSILFSHCKDGVWVESCAKDSEAITLSEYRKKIWLKVK